MAAKKATVRRRRPRTDFSKAVQECIARFDAETRGGDVDPVRVIDLVQELTRCIVAETGEGARDAVHNGIDDLIDAGARKGIGWIKDKIVGAVAKGTS